MSTSAPIFSLSGEAPSGASRARAESAAWAQFAQSRDRSEFCRSWLAILCAQIERVSGALLVLAERDDAPGDSFGAAAVWPDPARSMQYLAATAERTLKERRGTLTAADGVSRPVPGQPAYVGYPIEVGGRLHGAVVLDLAPGPGPDFQQALRRLHWGSAWLTDRIRRHALEAQSLQLARVSLASELVATAIQERRFGASALALVNEIAVRLECHRASIGFERHGSVEVQAISHTAHFDRRTRLARLIGNAMDEALDLAAIVVHPAPADASAGGDGNSVVSGRAAATGTGSRDAGTAAAGGEDASLARSPRAEPVASSRGKGTEAGSPHNDAVAGGHYADAVAGGHYADTVAGVAQAELAEEGRSSHVCSVPLTDAGETIGVLTLERGGDAAPFSAETLQLCRALGLMLGPIFGLKRENERGLWRRGADTAAASWRVLAGAGHPGAKLFAMLFAAVVLFFAFATVPYRVSARTVIEGAVQRAVVAPFEGYVADSSARAGDTVAKGQVLARLVDRELLLEQTRWASERELAQRKYRQAAALPDRAAMAMASAQADQAQAQLSLVEQKLVRATLTAPFDGIVVVGDLSQLQGSPVETGKVLFEIAPLDAYRVVLNVDERDIGEIRSGQTGELALAGLPAERLRFIVRQVTPISQAQEGRNVFRVEAQIDAPRAARLRPGMEGIGKIAVADRKLVWVWTHGFTDWLRLAAWKWLP